MYTSIKKNLRFFHLRSFLPVKDMELFCPCGNQVGQDSSLVPKKERPHISWAGLSSLVTSKIFSHPPILPPAHSDLLTNQCSSYHVPSSNPEVIGHYPLLAPNCQSLPLIMKSSPSISFI